MFFHSLLGIKNSTFQDLQDKIAKDEGSNTYKSLFFTGSCLTTGKCEIFSHIHTPDMIIADAVRISMSIPFVFFPQKCWIKDKNGKRVLDPNRENLLYVDGGLLLNYPIR